MNTLVARTCALLGGLGLAGPALAQFPQLITDFEVSGAGDPYAIQAASLGPLEVVMLQDPREADVTINNVLADAFATLSGGAPPLPSTEESFVAAFAGFGGANGSAQFLDIRFEWVTPGDANRWALVETLQSPTLGDPSVHLDGKVRLYINIPNCHQFEYPGTFTGPSELGIALLISETGRRFPQGFQDPDVLLGDFEFVGVDSVADPNTANPVPVPTTFIPLTDPNCVGASTGPAGNWRLVEFDLTTANVIGWSFRGGDGALDASASGDLVNRGVLAGIVIAPRQTDTTSDFAEVLIDQISFDAPVTEPAVAPAIAGPVVDGNSSVQVNGVTPRATNVTLEVDLSDGNNDDAFVADATYNMAPGLSTTGEARFVSIAVAPNLAIGDRVRARQQVGGDVGPYSAIIKVNPPAAFTATLSLDEDGNLGAAPADFEFVGASLTIGNAPQGKPVFPQNGVWQKLEFSLIPGAEPVASFAGGDGQLAPDGGSYNIDAMFFSIDATSPSAGPYEIYVDHVYYIDAADNEVVIADAEVVNPFPSRRGQSTSVLATWTSTLSTAASFDGTTSNRLFWEFPDTATGNTHSPFRPAANFPDSAKAVGMYLLVGDPPVSPLPRPTIEQNVIGDAPLVQVNNIDPNAVSVTLLVNGAAAGSVNPGGAASVNIDPTVSLAIGDSISARYSTAGNTSDDALPRGVRLPNPPSVPASLVAGQTSVLVSNINNTGNAVASLVRVFNGNTLIGSANPAGNASVSVTVPALSVGQQIAATQTVNAAASNQGAPTGVGSGTPICVLINEFQYDDSGTDTREFVEIYNAESTPVDISGWTLRSSDTVAPPGDNNPDYVVPAATILAAGDFYVFGHATVPNVDQILVGADLWENDNEAIQLLDGDGVVQDTVVYEFNKGNVAVSPAEGGIFANFSSIDGNEQSWGRWLDGYDTDDNGRDFGTLAATPGAPNNPAPVSPFTDNFDGTTIGANATNWIGSFVRARYIDPAVATAPNPNAISASPQGGNAVICWDPSGGGNGCALIDEARYNVGFSMQVYIQANGAEFTAGNAAAGERVDWSIGLGTMDQLANFPTANGNTGLAWEFRIIEDADTGAVGTLQLLLVDRNNSGNDGTTLFSVPQVDLTTGWHTLTLEQNYGAYSASFDAHVVNGAIATNGPATLQVGFREAVAGVPAAIRPPTFDALTITAPAPPALGECCTDCYCDDLTEAMCDAIGGTFAGGCIGDVDNDGDTDLDDLLLVLGNFGDPGPGSPGDADGDGDTDLDDLLLVLGNFNCI